MDSIGISIGIESLDLESISISIEFLTLHSISIVSVSEKVVSKTSGQHNAIPNWNDVKS